MIGYLDTSAFVPLLVAESTSAQCRRFWDDADAVVSNRLLYVEAAAALAQARRMGRLSVRAHRVSRQRVDELWAQLHVAEVDQSAVARAAELADRFGLRGYDAVHCACAEQLITEDVVAATGDRQLLDTWSTLGLATYDPNLASSP